MMWTTSTLASIMHGCTIYLSDMARYAIIIGCVMLYGCCTPKVVTATTQDSVRVEVVERIVEVRDTTYIEVERDSQSVVVRDTASTLSNRWATSRASIDSLGFLHHSLLTIPQTIAEPCTIFVPVADTTRTRVLLRTNVVEVERELTWWQQAKMKGFWFLLSIVAIWAVWRGCNGLRER